MKVRMLTRMAGPNGCAEQGAIIDVSREQAAALIAGNHAEELDKPKIKAKPETATSKRPDAESRAGSGATPRVTPPGPPQAPPRVTPDKK